jgi:hypothetical protein
LFQVVLGATRPISLMTVSFLNEQRADFGCSPTLPPSDSAALSARLQLAERWLNTRYRGLLEVHETDCWSAVGYRGAEFQHRTVREFLSTEDVQRILRAYSSREVDTNYFLCQSSLMQIRMLHDVKSIGLFELIDEVMHYAQSLDERKQHQLKRFLRWPSWQSCTIGRDALCPRTWLSLSDLSTCKRHSRSR